MQSHSGIGLLSSLILHQLWPWFSLLSVTLLLMLEDRTVHEAQALPHTDWNPGPAGQVLYAVCCSPSVSTHSLFPPEAGRLRLALESI